MGQKDWQDETPEANSPTGINPEDVIVGGTDDDPVNEAYARTGRADTSGTSGIPAYDEDAGKQRRDLYDEGAEFVGRID
jgi:hypothetical protein